MQAINLLKMAPTNPGAVTKEGDRAILSRLIAEINVLQAFLYKKKIFFLYKKNILKIAGAPVEGN